MDFDKITIDAVSYNVKDSTARKQISDETTELNSRISTIIADGQQTEGNTELIDIRTGADGKVYPTAGDAVRGQIGALSEENAELKEDIDKYIIAKYSGSVITSRAPSLVLRYACPINKGDKVSIKSEYDGDNIKKYDIRFYDASGNIHIIATSVQFAENYTFVAEESYSEVSLYAHSDNIVEGMRFTTVVSVDGVVLNDIHDGRERI